MTPYATVLDVIHLVCRLRNRPFHEGRDALERTGLHALSGRSIRELSSGQRRRAVLAAAWIGSPKVIILDEPLESMDRAIRAEILAWIDRLLANGAAIMIATHQIDPFLSNAARVLAVFNGRCRVVDPLVGDSAQRLANFESLTRGE